MSLPIRRSRKPAGLISAAGGLLGGALLLAPHPARAQFMSFAEGGRRLEFYDVDFSALADPALRTAPLDALHYIPIELGPSSFLSLGGEIRQQIWAWSFSAHGLRPPQANAYNLSHLLFDAYFHLDQHLAFFVELGRYDAFGKAAPLGAADASEGRLQQGFAEIKERIAGTDVRARLGRQEIALGSDRFVWINDSSNIRTTQDGAHVTMKTQSGAVLDFAAMRPTAPVAQPFADWLSHTGSFFAAYASEPLLGSELHFDQYLFSVHTVGARYDGLTGNEERETVGGRLWGGFGPFLYDSDFAYQFGDFSGRPVRAFGTSTRILYQLPSLPWRPAVQFQASYFSGSNGSPANPQVIGTFNPPFPRPSMLNYAGLETLENLIEAYPALVLRPSSAIAFRFGPELMWRASVNDAVYVSRTVPLPATLGNNSRFIGANLIGAASFTVNADFRIFAEYVHEIAGPAILRAGGHGTDVAVLQLDLDF